MIIKAVTIDATTRRKDRSVSIRMTTMVEQTSEDLKELDMLFQQHAVIAIKPESNPFTDAQIEELDSIDVDLEDTNKTPSKRLRNVIWIYHSQVLGRTPTKEEFREFYNAHIEKKINEYKDKLD